MSNTANIMIRATLALMLSAPSAVLIVGVSTSPAQAFELFGKCLFGKCEEPQDEERELIDPKQYDVQFVVNQGRSEGIEEAVKATSELWVGRDSAVSGSAGLLERAQNDYERILAALYNEGHYGGTISIRINGAEAATIPLGIQFPQLSSVAVSVDHGAPYSFGTATIENRAPVEDNEFDKVKQPEKIGFLSGKPARADVVRKAGLLATEAWRQQGHPFAKVAKRNARALHKQKLLNVMLRMEPGPKANFGPVSVEGADRLNPEFLAYMTGINEGEEYDPDVLKKSQQRLDRLGVLASRNLTIAKKLNAQGQVPVKLKVSERKRNRIGLGLTASSLDGVSIESYWLNRSLFGKAERFRVDAKVSGLGRHANLEKLDFFFGTKFIKPGVFSPDNDLLVDTFVKKEDNKTFLETSGEVSVALKRYESHRLTYSAGAFTNYGEFEDGFGKRRFFATGLQGDIIYDARDSKVDPSTGYFARVDVRPFYEWEFGNAAARIEAEGRAYATKKKKGDSVLAGRVKLGSVAGATLSQTPPNLLFTSGGGTSVRGYGYKSIGVDNTADGSSAGASLLEGSVEFRQKLPRNFGIVGFVDAGIVGENSVIDFNQPLHTGVGLGLRYYTSLGPIRVDLAVPLNPRKDDPKFAIYAGIGQAF